MFGAAAFFEGAGIEVHAAADLGVVEGDGAEATVEGFVFEAVGVILARVGALVGLGLEDLAALAAHGLVDEEADAFSEAFGALRRDKLQDVVQEDRLGVVGHVWRRAACGGPRTILATYLYRRWKARLGGPKAIRAMAHKLARVLWHLLKYKEACNPEVFKKEEEKMKKKKLARLHNLAAALKCQVTPLP